MAPAKKAAAPGRAKSGTGAKSPPAKPAPPAKAVSTKAASARAGKAADTPAGRSSVRESAARASSRQKTASAGERGKAQAPAPELDAEELDQRVRVLRRFRELLQAQRDRFRQYLDVLEKQKDLIEADWAASSGDALEAHVNLESRIVEDILSIQKVIEPLETMYRSAWPAPKRRGRPRKDAAKPDIPDLKNTLEELRNEAGVMVERNKALLSRKMAAVQEEIKSMAKSPYHKGRSVYGETPVPSLIDIEG